jgi:hypothetical protein
VPSGKTYNRKKDKKRIGREFRDEFLAGLFKAGKSKWQQPSLFIFYEEESADICYNGSAM